MVEYFLDFYERIIARHENHPCPPCPDMGWKELAGMRRG